MTRDDDPSRRRFLELVGGAGGLGALAFLGAGCGGDDGEDRAARPAGAGTGERTQDADALNDLEIVNYALTLEYLEADFYRRVMESDVIDDPEIADLVQRFGQTEAEHVTALEATAKELGGPVADRPRTNFDDIIDGGPDRVLVAAADVENLGAAAYLGQAPNIRSKEILAAALAIHTVEARHAAALNELVGRRFQGDAPLEGSVPNGAFAQPMQMDAVLRRIQPFLAS